VTLIIFKWLTDCYRSHLCPPRLAVKEATKGWSLGSRLDEAARRTEDDRQTQEISEAATNAKAALGYCKEGGCWLSRPNYFTLLRKNADNAFAFVIGGDATLGSRLCNSSARGNSTTASARDFDLMFVCHNPRASCMDTLGFNV